MCSKTYTLNSVTHAFNLEYYIITPEQSVMMCLCSCAENVILVKGADNLMKMRKEMDYALDTILLYNLSYYFHSLQEDFLTPWKMEMG